MRVLKLALCLRTIGRLLNIAVLKAQRNAELHLMCPLVWGVLISNLCTQETFGRGGADQMQGCSPTLSLQPGIDGTGSAGVVAHNRGLHHGSILQLPQKMKFKAALCCRVAQRTDLFGMRARDFFPPCKMWGSFNKPAVTFYWSCRAGVSKISLGDQIWSTVPACGSQTIPTCSIENWCGMQCTQPGLQPVRVLHTAPAPD